MTGKMHGAYVHRDRFGLVVMMLVLKSFSNKNALAK
jgi:hypothetical protein